MKQAKNKFWPKGVPLSCMVPQVTLPHFLEAAALRYPEKTAIVYCGENISYARLKQYVDAMSGYMQKQMHIAKGDRVLLMSQNCPQFVIVYYAVLQLGGVIVPVNAMCTTPEIQYYMEDSGARCAFVAQELLPQILPCMAQNRPDGLRHVMVHAYGDFVADLNNPDLPDLVKQAKAWEPAPGLVDFAAAVAAALPLSPVQVDPDDFCVLPYTSGTTGHPKGCIHTHATLLASLNSSAIWRSLHAESVFLAVAPMFHMLGMQNGMNLPIMLGATVVMMPRWHAGQALALIEKHRVSVWTAPPAMVLDCFSQPDVLQRDLSSLALLGGGGAAMPEAVATMLKERFDIVYNEGYGMTETASFLHCNPVAHAKRQCLGIPTQDVDSRIVDPGTLQELPQGEVGELVTSGKQVMKGYWNNEQANEESFIELDGKRFFRTGDLARIDEDGYFFMSDRLKRMINVSGYKVWPSEVENAMYQHPAIHEVCIVGIQDERKGEVVKALVVLKPGYEGRVSGQEIIDWAREIMAVYKAPRLVQFVDGLPKSNTGKIMWRKLQEEQNEPQASGSAC
ncbi:long-chain-fatty-acid--CoA ligase [Advenella sp. RU8]|uniref:long-chain-fatty-acid--CoA ligase n=1 Tax=Advenella sp. RU8 TaxID=3399575 RepID=UPI003AAD5AAC